MIQQKSRVPTNGDRHTAAMVGQQWGGAPECEELHFWTHHYSDPAAAVFYSMDLDQSGTLDVFELTSALSDLGLGAEDIDTIFLSLDLDGNRVVTLEVKSEHCSTTLSNLDARQEFRKTHAQIPRIRQLFSAWHREVNAVSS